jgi:hypothetical protein
MSGTLLSDLDGRSPVIGNDGDLVNKILADMNSPSESNPIHSMQQQQQPQYQSSGGGGSMIPPAPSGRVINSPNPNTVYPNAVDTGTGPNVHMIGKEYPTPGDFAQMMNNNYGNSVQAANHPGAMMMQQNVGGMMSAPGYQSYGYNGGAPGPQLMPLSSGSSSSFIVDLFNQFRQPILVAIIFFALSLPVVNLIIAHYLPSLVHIGGDLTLVGILLKSGVAGGLFWFFTKVLVPLLGIK